MLLSLGLLFADYRFRQLDTVRSALTTLVTPIQIVVDFPTQVWNWANRMAADHDMLLEENQELKAQSLFLQGKLQKMAALTAENVRLRELLNGSGRIDERLEVAEVIGVDPDPFTQEIVINKGQNDKVFAGQPVLDAYGVMGQVISVSRYTSRVMLVTDSRQMLPVEINRTGARTLAAGNGLLEKLDLLYLPNNEDVQVGDVLVTSGLGGLFPAGYPVAVVDQVHPNPGQNFAKVLASPSAQLGRSRQVLLVYMPQLRLEQEPAAEQDGSGPASTLPADADQESLDQESSGVNSAEQSRTGQESTDQGSTESGVPE